MDEKQKAFLERLVGKSVERSSQSSMNSVRDAVLENLQNNMAERGERLREQSNLEVVNARGKKQKVLNYEIRDQLTEFDLDEEWDGYVLVEDTEDDENSQDNFLLHLEAGRIVTDLSRELEATVTVQVPLDPPQFDAEGNLVMETVEKPLYEGEELKQALSEELYQPLVREGLMAETYVPDEFSETKQMLTGSFDAYKERLEEEGLNNKVFSPENFAMASTFLSSGLSIVGGAGGIKGAAELKASDVDPSKLGPSLDFFTDDLAKKKDFGAIADAAKMTFEALLLIKDGVEDAGGSSEAASTPMQKIAFAITSAAGMTFTQIFAESGEDIPPSIPVAISTFFNGKVDTNRVAKCLMEVQPEEASEDGIETAAKAIAKAFDEAITKAGITPRSNFEAATTIDKASVAADLREEKYDRVIAAFQTSLRTAVDGGKAPIIQFLKVNKDTLESALGETIANEMTERINQDAEESKRELAAIENERNEERRASLIEEKIKKLERDTKIIDWAVKLSKMTFDVGSKFVGPLAIGGSLISLMENTAKATQRACDAAIFLDSKQDMLRAASPYSAPVSNFVHNSRVQATHYSVNAALDGLNMAGAIVETLGYAAGPGAAAGVAVGKIIQAAATIAQAIEAVLYEIGKRYDLEKAWSTYRAALSRPNNRKLGLIALKKNPTLAKYAVAWGAVVKQDVLVSDFLTKTGLTAESLRDPKANVNQVVKYLELRLPDDNVVVGRSGTKDWEPKTIELTASCFITGKANAIKKAKLKDEPTRDIELALAEYQTKAAEKQKRLAQLRTGDLPSAVPNAAVADQERIWSGGQLYWNNSGGEVVLPDAINDLATQTALEVEMDCREYQVVCRHAKTALLAYKPTNRDSEPHSEMGNFVSTLRDLVDQADGLVPIL